MTDLAMACEVFSSQTSLMRFPTAAACESAAGAIGDATRAYIMLYPRMARQ